MNDNEQRLDIRKCNDQGVNRLVTAILMDAVRDWNIYSKSINKRGINDGDMYELKQIIDFIQSNYFIALTNDSCPQRDCVDELIKKVTDKKANEELRNYALINENKWIRNNSCKAIKVETIINK